MISHYLKILGRQFLNQKFHSLLNVLGLAIGMGCSLLIALYVLDELSFDEQHPNADRLFRMSKQFIGQDTPVYLAGNDPQAGPLLSNNFAEIEEYTRVYPRGLIVSVDEQRFFERDLRMVDASFLHLFDLEWLAGDVDSALSRPNTAVLSRSFADKYFGNDDPLGKTLLLENNVPVTVTGVIADLPANMHLTGSAFISMETLSEIAGGSVFQNWASFNFHTYFLLRPGVDYAELEPLLASFLEQNKPEEARGFWDYSGLNVQDIHLHSNAPDLEMGNPGDRGDLFVLASIAAAVLMIAAFNLVNISTANYTRRINEVGIRKTIGSSRGQLVRQFLLESELLIGISFLVAVLLVELSLPAMNGFSGKSISLGVIMRPEIIAAVVAGVFSLGLLAGVYPALFLSRFKPLEVFRTGFGSEFSGVSLRSLLVVCQFSATIVLVVASFIIFKQVQLGKTIDLGFTKDEIVVINRVSFESEGRQWESFKETLLSHPGINSVTRSSVRPFQQFSSSRPVRVEEVALEAINMTNVRVDFDFFETYDVDVLAGRTFSRAFATDRVVAPNADNPSSTGAFVLNRSAAEMLGLTPEEAIGMWFDLGFSSDFSQSARGTIIGVVEDMHLESVRQKIDPLFFFVPPINASLPSVSLKLVPGMSESTLAFVDETWNEFYPDRPIDRQFLDSGFESLYQPEERFGQLLSAFSVLTISIACLGLLGLTLFMTESRKKEIGIRKVMGSSVWRIVLLLTNDFSKLVLLSNVIAWPVAWFAMNRWLENFAYRIDLTPLIFIGSGLIALCIAWVTVGSTAAKAASRKPVLALRYE